MRKFIIVIAILILVDILIVLIGGPVAHKASLSGNYIGKIDHVYFDNSSSTELMESDLDNIWRIIHRGAPGPFLFVKKFITRRVEIIEIGRPDRLDQQCGSVTTKEYTFFNALFYKGTVNIHCAY